MMMSTIHAHRASRHFVQFHAHRNGHQKTRTGKLTLSKLPSDADLSKYEIENSYRMNPDPEHTFQSKAIEEQIHSILSEKLKGITLYDTEVMSCLTTELSSHIKQRIKSLGMHRYKLVCHVVIGENKDQDVRVTSHSLRDPHVDGSACAAYQNDVIFAVATVHGIYFE